MQQQLSMHGCPQFPKVNDYSCDSQLWCTLRTLNEVVKFESSVHLRTLENCPSREKLLMFQYLLCMQFLVWTGQEVVIIMLKVMNLTTFLCEVHKHLKLRYIEVIYRLNVASTKKIQSFKKLIIIYILVKFKTFLIWIIKTIYN